MLPTRTDAMGHAGPLSDDPSCASDVDDARAATRTCRPMLNVPRGAPLSRPIRSTMLPRPVMVGSVLLLASTALPASGRTWGVLATVLLLASAAVLANAAAPRPPARLGLGLLIGLLPAVTLIGVAHDLTGASIPVAISRVLVAGALVVSTWAFGVPIVDRIVGRRALADVVARTMGVLAVTGFMTGALTRHLTSPRGTVARLAWVMSEEDNAHVIGAAREVLTHGPRGTKLADQYGTAFINLPLTFQRLLGGPLVGETDVRLQAITVFLVSTILIIALAGLAMALVASLPHHVAGLRRGRERSLDVPTLLLGAPVAGASALAVFALLVVLPMRTGFLTFVWGLTLVAGAGALVAVTPSDAPRRTRVLLVVHLVATVLLLLSSWPFIVLAVVPLLALPLTWVDWRRLRERARRDPRTTGLVMSASIAVIAGLAVWFLRWGPLAEVLSYGRDILLIQASGIFADRAAVRVAAGLMVVAVLLTIALVARRDVIPLLLGVAGPPVAAVLFYLGLRAAAALLTDGELNYSGIKLFYGVVTLAALMGLPLLASMASRLRAPGLLAVATVVAYAFVASSTLQLVTDWWDRTDPQWAPHAEATVQAIRGSSPDLPIRCLPPPGVAVTDRTKWAAFFCVRWMEAAFNEDRFHGHRFEFLTTDDETFEGVVEQVLSESPSRYLFAYPFTMGPGWFGWNGTD